MVMWMHLLNDKLRNVYKTAHSVKHHAFLSQHINAEKSLVSHFFGVQLAKCSISVYFVQVLVISHV